MYEMALIVAALMFSLQAFANQRYQRMQGSFPGSALRLSLWSSLMGAIIPVITQGMRFEFSWFSVGIAAWSTVNGVLYTICSLRALETANLSVFMTFSMLGGVMVPFAGGIILWNEAITWQKMLCLALLSASILLNIRRGTPKPSGKRSPLIDYFAVFICNGLGGFINKVHQSFPDLAVDSGSYSTWCRLMAVGVSVGCLLVQRQSLLPYMPQRQKTYRVWCNLFLMAVLGLAANWILLVALLHVDASVSYTLTNGSTIVFATVLSVIRRERPDRRQVMAVMFAFLGLLCLAM